MTVHHSQCRTSGALRSDFYWIEAFCKALKDRKIEMDPAGLAQKIAGTKNHVVAALEKLGVEKKEAKR